MPERIAGLGLDVAEHEMVDMAADESVDDEAHLESVGGHGGGLDGRRGLVDLGAAVARLVDIGEGIEGVVLHVGGRGGVDGVGERDFETIIAGGDVVHLEGRLTLEAHALEGEGLRTARTPATIGTTDEERAVFLVHADRDQAGFEAAEEVEHGALIEAVHLLEIDALDLRSGLLTDEQLAFPRTELALGHIAGDAGRRVADLAVREHDGRRHELGELEALGEDARAAGGLRRRGEVREGSRLVAGRVALERSGAQPLERGRAVPDALVVGVEVITLVVVADTARRTDAGSHRDELAVRGDLGGPAAPRSVRVERTRQAEDHPDVAVLVRIRTEGVFMVVAADAPLGADGVEAVRAAVTVLVRQAGVLGALSGEERAVLKEHAEGLVQVGGELGPLDLGDIGVVGAFGDPDVAAARADGDLLARQEGDRGDFADLAGRRGDLDAFVELRLTGLGGADGVDGRELAGVGGLGRSGMGEAGGGEEEEEVFHMMSFRSGD